MKPWLVRQWVIPPRQNADFVYHMENVLAVYERPYDQRYPTVCLDESPKQLIEIVQYRAADGVTIQDSEYIRRGVGEIYMAFEPLAGRRFVSVHDNHRAVTWVGVIAGLLDGPYADCVRMTLVGDNGSGHPVERPQARRVLRRFRARGGKGLPRPPRVRLHAQARQLAGYG